MATLEGSDRDEREISVIPVLTVGQKVSYTVPSFPAFTAVVRVMKFEVYGEDSINVETYHGLIRDCPKVDRMYPALALVRPGCPNGFFVEVNHLCTGHACHHSYRSLLWPIHGAM